MKLYKIKSKEYYESFSIKDYEKVEEFKGVEKLSNNWSERKLKVITKGSEADLIFCWNPMKHMMVSEQTLNVLNEYFDSDDIELLPVSYRKKTYYIIHGIKAYDLECTCVERGRKILDIFNEMELIEKGMEQKCMFRVQFSYGVLSEMFYTEKFMKLISEHDLQGVDFEVVWDSEVDI